MAKLTLSVHDDVVRDAKHLALDRRTTVSELVERGLRMFIRHELHDIAEIQLRAWHHYPEATPFIIPALLAFRDEGFEVEPQKTTFRLTKAGRRYVVQHKKTSAGRVLRVHPWGTKSEVVVEKNVTELATRLRRSRGTTALAGVLREVWQFAKAVSEHAARP